MFNTGLGKYRTATVDNFTSDIGIKLRRVFLGKIWRQILKLCTKRKIIIEKYPELKNDEVYIFCCNHSFDEDIISALASIDRNVYMLQGTTDQMLHNPIFIALWLNGMIYLDRMNADSRKQAVEKMKRILKSGTSVLLFPEGGNNNTENQLIQPLFYSPWMLSKELKVKVIPLISFNDIGTDKIYIRAGEPLDLAMLDKDEAMDLLRDEMSTIVYNIMEEHVSPLKRKDLPLDIHETWLKIRKQVYDCQNWYKDVWEEEVTYYPGHGVTTPQKAREFVDKVNINSKNAYIMADTLIRREEDLKYDLIKYLRENMQNRGVLLNVIQNGLHPILLFVMKKQRVLRGQKLIKLNECPAFKSKNALYVCNHSCRYDIPFACEIIGHRSNVLVGKQRLEFVDRLCFVLNGVIWVDRHSSIDKKRASQKMQELLLKGESVLMFPEGTWNLEPSKPMLPMYWGCIDIARYANVPIVPFVLEYKGKACHVKFGEPLYVKETDEKSAKFEELSETMATLKWEIWETFSIMRRQELDLLEWEREKVARVKAYPKLDYEYEMSCVRNKK